MEVLEGGVKEWGLSLTPQQVQAFEFYYQELIDWNERVNLTSITDYEEVQDEGRWPVVGVEVEHCVEAPALLLSVFCFGGQPEPGLDNQGPAACGPCPRPYPLFRESPQLRDEVSCCLLTHSHEAAPCMRNRASSHVADARLGIQFVPLFFHPQRVWTDLGVAALESVETYFHGFDEPGHGVEA